MKQATARIDDYATTAHATQLRVSGYSGQQPGDPVRAAEAIIRAVESPSPPLRLLLGRIALQAARAKLESLRLNFDAWEETTPEGRLSDLMNASR